MEGELLSQLLPQGTAEEPENLSPYLQKIRAAAATLSNPAAQRPTRHTAWSFISHKEKQKAAQSNSLRFLVGKLSQVIKNYDTCEPKIVPPHTYALQERPVLRNPSRTTFASDPFRLCNSPAFGGPVSGPNCQSRKSLIDFAVTLQTWSNPV